MKAQRPYLLRALYDWIVDSDDVPYVVVKADVEGVQVPAEHVQDGQIVLNIGPSAVRNLVLGDDFVMCNGRFGGRDFELVLPMASIAAIYSKSAGEGMVFPAEASLGAPLAAGAMQAVDASGQIAEEDPETGAEDPARPTLRLV